MTITRTRTAAQAYAYGLVGQSRDHLPVPWTNSRVMDDCAAFCSHVIWGGKPGPILWVDNFKTAGDGTYKPGDVDLAPMDVLLFDWEGNGVGNHVEFMVGDLGNGYVRTYGANGSDTRAAAYRLRPARYILGRFRPRWATAVGAPIKHTIPAATTPQTPTPRRSTTRMDHIIQAPYRDGGPRYSVLIEPGTATLLNDERFRYWTGLKDSTGTPLYPVIQTNARGLALAKEHRTLVTNGIELR